MTDAQDYKGGAYIASMQHIGQRYTQLLEAQERIAQLEAALKRIAKCKDIDEGDLARPTLEANIARAALKAKP
jgi:type II secretory pathway component PulJ